MSAEITSLLAEYILALHRGLEATHQTEERPQYTRHLAEAALIFAYLHHDDLESAKRIVAGEIRSFGWSFLTGETGDQAVNSFWTLARSLEVG